MRGAKRRVVVVNGEQDALWGNVAVSACVVLAVLLIAGLVAYVITLSSRKNKRRRRRRRTRARRTSDDDSSSSSSDDDDDDDNYARLHKRDIKRISETVLKALEAKRRMPPGRKSIV